MSEWFVMASAMLALAVAGSFGDQDVAPKRCQVQSAPVFWSNC